MHPRSLAPHPCIPWLHHFLLPKGPLCARCAAPSPAPVPVHSCPGLMRCMLLPGPEADLPGPQGRVGVFQVWVRGDEVALAGVVCRGASRTAGGIRARGMKGTRGRESCTGAHALRPARAPVVCAKVKTLRAASIPCSWGIERRNQSRIMTRPGHLDGTWITQGCCRYRRGRRGSRDQRRGAGWNGRDEVSPGHASRWSGANRPHIASYTFNSPYRGPGADVPGVSHQVARHL